MSFDKAPKFIEEVYNFKFSYPFIRFIISVPFIDKFIEFYSIPINVEV